MTILCALRLDGRVLIGSDRQSGGGMTFLSEPKWVVHGAWALGIAGQHRAQELVEQNPDVLAGTPYEIGIAIRRLFLADGAEPLRDDNGCGWQHFGQHMLVVSAAGIWSMDTVFCSARVMEEFFAEGSGREFAWGAFYAARKAGERDPAKLMRTCLDAAIEYDDACGGEPWIREMTESAALAAE